MKTLIHSLILASLAVITIGCGTNPTQGADDNAAKKVMDTGSYDQQKDLIQRSPIPPEEKKRQMDELDKKFGKSAPAGQ